MGIGAAPECGLIVDHVDPLASPGRLGWHSAELRRAAQPQPGGCWLVRGKIRSYVSFFVSFACFWASLRFFTSHVALLKSQPTLARHKRVERAGVLVGRVLPVLRRLGRIQHSIHLAADLLTPRGLGFLVLLLVLQDHVVGLGAWQRRVRLPPPTRLHLGFPGFQAILKRRCLSHLDTRTNILDIPRLTISTRAI